MKERELLSNKARVIEEFGANVYTIDDLLEYFNISRIYLYKLIEFGKLPKAAEKVGRYRVYTQKQMNDILASGLLNHRINTKREKRVTVCPCCKKEKSY